MRRLRFHRCHPVAEQRQAIASDASPRTKRAFTFELRSNDRRPDRTGRSIAENHIPDNSLLDCRGITSDSMIRRSNHLTYCSHLSSLCDFESPSDWFPRIYIRGYRMPSRCDCWLWTITLAPRGGCVFTFVTQLQRNDRRPPRTGRFPSPN